MITDYYTAYCGVAASSKALPSLPLRHQSPKYFIHRMAALSSKWRPAVSLGDRSRSPISRPSSPSLQAGESATSIAWRNALHSYRKSLSEKDFKRITIPAGPEDVANEVDKWQCRQSASRYARVAAAIRAGVSRMQHFSASIDMLAQGSPAPSCLLWGSIKFVLTVGILLRLLPQTGIDHEPWISLKAFFNDM